MLMLLLAMLPVLGLVGARAVTFGLDRAARQTICCGIAADMSGARGLALAPSPGAVRVLLVRARVVCAEHAEYTP